MLKLNRTIAIALTALSLVLSTPALSRADEHGDEHGPRPLMLIGCIGYSTLWAVSVPFSALFAPRHVLDSFEGLVARPWRIALGQEEMPTTTIPPTW